MLIASETLPEFQYPFELILTNVEEFGIYLQNLKETLFVKKKRYEAFIHLTNEADDEVLALLRIYLVDERMEDVAQDTKRELLRARGDKKETVSALIPGVYHVSYPDVFLIVLNYN